MLPFSTSAGYVVFQQIFNDSPREDIEVLVSSIRGETSACDANHLMQTMMVILGAFSLDAMQSAAVF
jgi:hypothetical protein